MRLCTLASLFLIGYKAQINESTPAPPINIIGNGSLYLPPGTEPVIASLLSSYRALSNCGEGDDRGKRACVPYHRCNSNSNITTPENISIRNKTLVDMRQNTNLCEFYMDVCCDITSNNTSIASIPSTSRTFTVKLTSQPSLCGIRNENGIDFKITGHVNEAEYGEFPWVIAILKKNFNPKIDKNELICGASLIAPNVVLTGARCVRKYKINEIKVRAGEWDTLTEKERLPRIIIHEKYEESSLINNVALLLLDKPIAQADNVGIICLPFSKQVFNSTECFTGGWGRKNFGSTFDKNKYSAILKKLKLPIIPRDKCERVLKNTRLGQYYALDKSFICAGGEAGVDTCTGDGGSPLVCPDLSTPGRYVQIGMVSWGVGCGEKGLPGVYGNIPLFRSWIDEQMHNFQSNSAPYSA